ncbi:protein DMP10 [Mangifera indica]|uniref:protein DMP10 n=1 Tax=Mangifera indica TaxID=29780 RepID=UPI001CF9A341|nr:protein DMP10 [Mangifera indica]
MTKSGSKSLSAAANLANLLPTGTVLAFQALAPSFSNGGSCLPANKYLTLSIIVFCSVVCFFSSFTDSFIDENGKLFYGIATFKGLYIFNKEDQEDKETDIEKVNAAGKKCNKNEEFRKLQKYRIHSKDFLHALLSLLVFLVFATSSTDVQRCLFPHAGANENTLMINLPIAVGAFASFLFMIFPTKRKGIGYAPAKKCPNCKGKPQT